MPRKQGASRTNVASPVLGLAEVAELLGWDVRKVSVYLKRKHLPEPWTRISCGPLWRRSEIQAFQAETKANDGRIPSIKLRLRQITLDAYAPELRLRRRHERVEVRGIATEPMCIAVEHKTGPSAGRVVQVEIGCEYLIQPPYPQKLKHRGRRCTVLGWVFDDAGYVRAVSVRFQDTKRQGRLPLRDLIVE